MEALKLIPQIFFDAIARVVPGMVLIAGATWATRRSVTALAIRTLLPEASAPSAIATLLVLVFAAYVVGQLLSPLVRWLEDPPDGHAGQEAQPSTAQARAASHSGWPKLRGKLVPFFTFDSSKSEQLADTVARKLNASEGYEKKDAVWILYDWLRLNHSEVGALTAKIRAEYTMYGGLGVAFLIVLALRLLTFLLERITQLPVGPFVVDARLDVVLSLTVLIAARLMLSRHLSAYKTFRNSVLNFSQAALIPQHSPNPRKRVGT